MRLIVAATLVAALAVPSYAQFDGLDIGPSGGIVKPRSRILRRKMKPKKLIRTASIRYRRLRRKRSTRGGRFENTGNGKAANK